MANYFVNLHAQQVVSSEGEPVSSTPLNGNTALDVSVNGSGNVVSSGNSTSTPLGAGASFIGTFEEILPYSGISIVSRSNVNGTLFIEYSGDGTTVIAGPGSFAASPSTLVRTPVNAKYIRIRYTNGSTPQATFQLQTIYSVVPQSFSVAPLTSAVFDQTTALTTKSAQFGKNPDGVYENINATGTSAANTTTTLLGAGETFTGTYLDCSQYSAVATTIRTDVASALNGLVFQFSDNGTDIIREVKFTVSEGFAVDGQFYSVPAEGDWFRIKYTNGSTPQGVFRLQSQAHMTAPGTPVSPINSTITDDKATILTRAVLTGKSTDGSYANTRASGISTQNSTSTNLGGGATFVGQWEDVVGYTNVGIIAHTSHASAADGLKVEFSSNGTDIDNSDTYTLPANNGKVYTVGVTAKYFRIRYVNGPTPTTFLRISCIYHINAPKPSSHRINDAILDQDDAELVKAVLTGKRPDNVFGNINVTEINALQVAITDGQTNAPAVVSPQGELKVSQTRTMIGSNFFSTTIHANQWTTSVTNGGTVASADGRARLSTNTTANGTARLTSTRISRLLPGQDNEYFALIRLGDTGTLNNVRRWGVYDDNNGAFFELSNSQIRCVTRAGGVDTVVSSFNGNVPFTLDTLYHNYTIYYRYGGVYFLQDKKLVHFTTDTISSPLLQNGHLRIRMENNNSGGSTSACVLDCSGSSISRLGEAEPSPSFYNSTTAETVTFRNTPGTLHRVAVNSKGSGGASLTIYDNSAASGTTIATINLADFQGVLDYGLDFDNGLTIVTAGSGINVTIMYS